MRSRHRRSGRPKWPKYVDIYSPREHSPTDRRPVILTIPYEISGAQLLAAQGYVVVKYESDSPNSTFPFMVDFLEKNHRSIGIDPDRMGFWTCSSNPKVVLGFLAIQE